MTKNLGKSVLDDILMVLLALASVFLLIFEVVAHLTLEQAKVIQYADFSIALIFLGEFIFNLSRSKNKIHFFKNHWWELLASIPITTDLTQGLRTLRLFRLIRLLRLLRIVRLTVRLKILLDISQKFSKQTYLVYIMTVAGAIVVAGALGFHYFEADSNPNVHSFWDSFWWTVVTMATVGYGDIYPITTGGRIVAIFLMLSGIGTLGVFTAAIASYIIKKR